MSLDALGQLGPAAAQADSTPAAEREQVAKAAREFEAMFLLQMLKQMRQSMLSEENEEPGLGAATMTETIDVELSRHLAGQRGGLSTMLTKALGRDFAGTSPAVQRGPVMPSVKAPVIGPAESGLSTLDGRVSSDFGWRRDPITGAARFHRGMDIAAAYGEEVPAAAEGTVVFSGVQGAYGNVVIIKHDGGAETRYAHLSQVDVRQGEVVKAGDIVGRVGQTGRATGPHLHFEVREDGQPVDPSTVRLEDLQGND